MTEPEVETLRNRLEAAENRASQMEDRYDRLTVDYARVLAERQPKSGGDPMNLADQEAQRRHEEMRSLIALVVGNEMPSHVRGMLREMLTQPGLVHSELIAAVREEARELLAAFKTAAPNGPVISRHAIRDALAAVAHVPCDHVLKHTLDVACDSFREAGYFVV